MVSDHIVDSVRYAVRGDRTWDIAARMLNRKTTKSNTMREWLTDELIEQDLAWAISEVRRLRGEKADLLMQLRRKTTSLEISLRSNRKLCTMNCKLVSHIRRDRKKRDAWARKYMVEATKDEVCVV